MYKNFIKKIKCQVHHELQPHLSLLYKELPTSIKQDIVKWLNIKKTHVAFDSVKVITPKNPTQGWLDIGKWETVIRRELNDFI